jgi:hypothetical protein
VITLEPATPISLDCIGYGGSAALDSYYSGLFTEIIAYNRTLAPAERRAIERYLTSTYSIDSPDEASAFQYQTPRGVLFTVTSDGLSRIEQAGRIFAEGSWSMETPGQAFGDGEILQQALTRTGPTSVRVAQVQSHLTTTYDYTFTGEDVTIRAYVENNHPSATIDIAQFGGLTFRFHRPPDGYLPGGPDVAVPSQMYPSKLAPVGGCYGQDGAIGVGATPLDTGLTLSQLRWGGAGEIRSLDYRAQKLVPPGGARTFWLRIRVGPNTDWRWLMEPYKEYFLTTWGRLTYHPDHRALTRGIIEPDEASPLAGEQTGIQPHRWDPSLSMQAYATGQTQTLTAIGGQGSLFSIKRGSKSSATIPQTDFDVFSPALETNWPTLQHAYDDAGLHLGVDTMPGELTYRTTWDSTASVAINTGDPAQLEMVWRRFRTMIQRGCSLFYLKSFGSSLDDIRAMRYYRNKMGTDIQTFCQDPCDAMLPYSGAGFEVTYRGGLDPDQAYKLSCSEWFWELANWLLPGCGSAVTIQSEGPAGSESAEAWLYRRHLTPLLGHVAPGLAAIRLHLLEQRYMDDKGRWTN